VADDKEPAERAKDLLVYGPLGLALYLRDTAPSFLRLFVARGRAELDQRRRTVGDQLGQARAVGEFASAYGGSQAKSFLDEGLARVKARAEETLGALGVVVPEADGVEQRAEEHEAAATPGVEATGDVETTTEVPGPTVVAPSIDAPPRVPGAPRPPKQALAIPDYDELSASQVVDRLEGLTIPDLEAIRVYELAHRARNTVLGKIDQLTRR